MSLVWWECTVKGCEYRTKQHSACSEVSHTEGTGNRVHWMKKEAKK